MRIRVGVLLTAVVAALGLPVACNADRPSSPVHFLEPVADPSVLPYHFVVEERFGSSYQTEIVPLDLNGDGSLECYHIQQDQYKHGTQSSILFFPSVYRSHPEAQYNFFTKEITATFPYDYDRDGLLEVGLGYRSKDTVWFELLDPDSGSFYRKALAAGEDRDSNGTWDAYGYVAAVHDFNGDGFPEILFSTDTGYDLYPRNLTCLDWHRDTILWSFDVAGYVMEKHTYVVCSPDSSDCFVIFGVGSKDNTPRTADMDDQHGYLICLDARGRRQWMRITGGRFHTCKAILIDYDADGWSDVLFEALRIDADHRDADSAESDVNSSLVVVNVWGKTLDSIPMEKGRQVSDLSLTDPVVDIPAVVLVSFSDNACAVYDQQCNRRSLCRHPARIRIHCHDDLLGLGSPQFLVRTSDQKTWLLSADFEPLAQFTVQQHGGVPRIVRPSPDPHDVVILLSDNSAHDTYILRLERTPWYTIFYRRPILAFAAAFVPLSGIVLLIWTVMLRFRQKNRIISTQKDELARALSELREAQDRLVEVEKTQLMNDIAGGVAHEVRNALDPAVRCLHALQEEGETDSARVAQLTQLAEKSVRRAVGMARMVKELADLSAKPASDDTNLKAVIDDILAQARKRIDECGIAVQAEIPDGLVVRCPYNQAAALFGNLIRNAVDAVAGSDQREIRVGARATEGLITVHVTDSGPGIPPKERSRIFNAFYSTKPTTGMGLGLTFARRIAELHGGSLTLLDSPDGNTTFVVTLPRSRTPDSPLRTT